MGEILNDKDHLSIHITMQMRIVYRKPKYTDKTVDLPHGHWKNVNHIKLYHVYMKRNVHVLRTNGYGFC